MTETKDCIKWQMSICKELWAKDIQRLENKFELNDKALALHDNNLQLRLAALNELREEFSRKEGKFSLKTDANNIEKRVARIETVGAVWLTVITIIIIAIGAIARFWE